MILCFWSQDYVHKVKNILLDRKLYIRQQQVCEFSCDILEVEFKLF